MSSLCREGNWVEQELGVGHRIHEDSGFLTERVEVGSDVTWVHASSPCGHVENVVSLEKNHPGHESWSLRCLQEWLQGFWSFVETFHQAFAELRGLVWGRSKGVDRPGSLPSLCVSHPIC
jgi:hypothetical protein